jgi:microcystin-dependent protein
VSWAKLATEMGESDMHRLKLALPVFVAFIAGIAFVYSCSGSGGESAIGQASEGTVPVGTVLTFAGTTAPAGYLLADGSAVSRTTYAALFAAIGTAWGSGDGASTFHLPDLRGRFLRGVDGGAGVDPDAATRTENAPGGNTGDTVGSVQGDATALPNSAFTTDDPGNHTHTNQVASSTATGTTYPYRATGNAGVTWTSDAAGAHSHIVTAGGDGETRPSNAGVHYIIRY